MPENYVIFWHAQNDHLRIFSVHFPTNQLAIPSQNIRPQLITMSTPPPKRRRTQKQTQKPANPLDYKSTRKIEELIGHLRAAIYEQPQIIRAVLQDLVERGIMTHETRNATVVEAEEESNTFLEIHIRLAAKELGFKLVPITEDDDE